MKGRQWLGERESYSVEGERNITSQSRFVFFVRRFPGVPFQDTVFLMPTTNCLVSLSEPVSEFYLCMYVL